MIGIKKSAEPVFKWLSQQEDDLTSILAMPAPAPGNPDQLNKIRNHVKELQNSLSMIMIRIVDGEEVYNKFMKGSGGKIPGLSAEHEKLRAAYKKEKEEDLKMKEKEKKEQERNSAKSEFRMQGMIGRFGGERFQPYSGRKTWNNYPYPSVNSFSGFQLQHPDNLSLGQFPSRFVQPGLSDANKISRLQIDKSNSKCVRCGVFGHWHKDGVCKPEDIAKYQYERAVQGLSTYQGWSDPNAIYYSNQQPALNYSGNSYVNYQGN